MRSPVPSAGPLHGRRPAGGGALRRLAARPADEGVAVVTVLGAVVVLSLLVAGTLALASGTQRLARSDQDWNAALAAADAGIDDYLARLNQDETYWRYGDPSSGYSGASPVELPTGTDANPAFTGWVDIPGSDSRAQFRYDVNTEEFFTSGVVDVRATGRVGDRVRSVEVSISRRSFLDYLYFTDIEAKDPDAYSTSSGDSYDVADANALCDIRLWEGRTDRATNDAGNGGNPGCSIINFITADRIQGPLHSNDALYVCGSPRFEDEATTSYDGSQTGGRHYVRNLGCGSSAPVVPAQGDDLVYEPPLTLPPSNSALAAEVDPAQTGGDPGCLYTGPTEISLNADGTMDVASPWSADGGPMWCGTGSGLALPPRGVVWVRDVPATPDSYSQSLTCPSGGGNHLGYPVTTGSGGSARTDRTAYGCRTGDAFVSGSLSGQLTLGAANDIVVTDDLEYATGSCASTDSCVDVLGLVANNYVEVYHPYGCLSSGGSCTSLDSSTVDLRIEAAVLAVNHSFRVQNFRFGSPRGTLTVRGALGQRYRGPVGTGFSGSIATGYAKEYVYDWRLRYASPPHFIDPVQSAFGVKVWSEVDAAHSA